MNRLLGSLRICLPEHLFVKDPESSDLGQRIIEQSINLIDTLGFEAFTFKKLGVEIASSESTIYRYFENKHKLLLYLTSWYWAWLEYKVVFATANIENGEERLRNMIATICESVKQDDNFSHINEEKLQRIVIAESSKAFLTKQVDRENRLGYFSSYKSLSERMTTIIQEVKPQFKYAHSLVSVLLEGSHHQKFLRDHLPGLTNVSQDDRSVQLFFETMTFSMLNHGR